MVWLKREGLAPGTAATGSAPRTSEEEKVDVLCGRLYPDLDLFSLLETATIESFTFVAAVGSLWFGPFVHRNIRSGQMTSSALATAPGNDLPLAGASGNYLFRDQM